MAEQSGFEEINVGKLKDYFLRCKGDYPHIPITKISLCKYHTKWVKHLQRQMIQNWRNPQYVVVFEIYGFEWPSPKISSLSPPSLLLNGQDDKGTISDKLMTANLFSEPNTVSLDNHPWLDFLRELDNVPGRQRNQRSLFTYEGFEGIYQELPGPDYYRDWMFIAVRAGEIFPEYIYAGGTIEVLFNAQNEPPIGDELLRVIRTTTHGGKNLNDHPNYCVFCGGLWKLRFNGKDEFSIPKTKYMRTLAEYLLRSGDFIDKDELFDRFSRTGVIPDRDDGATKELLQKKKESQIEKLSSSNQKRYQAEFEKLLDQVERSKGVGREALESAEEDVEKFIKFITKEYSGAKCDRATGEIQWPSKMMERSQATRTGENITKQINNAINAIEKFGQIELADHLRKYLNKKDSRYAPPPDFPEWYIKI